MKLTNYIIDLGRVVAYYPNLKKVTGSTTATILLCQFLYWSDKARNGWIEKTADEIEEETGLTYNEQRTARRILVDLRLLEEEFKRLDHTSIYKVRQEELNRQWEKMVGKKSTPIVKPVPVEPNTAVQVELSGLTTVEEIEVPKSDAVKKGDWVDATLMFMNSPANKKVEAKKLIKEKIETTLNINVDNVKWEKFIEFVYQRETKDKQSIERFMNWALEQGFDPIYWTPEKMKTLYPRAFIEPVKMTASSDFVKPLPKPVEEDYAPMPRHIGRKQDEL